MSKKKFLKCMSLTTQVFGDNDTGLDQIRYCQGLEKYVKDNTSVQELTKSIQLSDTVSKKGITPIAIQNISIIVYTDR